MSMNPFLAKTGIKKVREERRKTSEHRYFLMELPLRNGAEKYPYLVCDGKQVWDEVVQNGKTLGRFKQESDAKLFLEAVRNQYTHGGRE